MAKTEEIVTHQKFLMKSFDIIIHEKKYFLRKRDRVFRVFKQDLLRK